MQSLVDSFARQHFAALAMLRQAVEVCPDDLWLEGEFPRSTWRIAYHAAYYVHLYLYPDLESFTVWEKHREKAGQLWGSPKKVEPYTREEMMEYIDLIVKEVPERLPLLDWNSPESGFPWYENCGKVEHMILSLRHVQGHTGQISELLIARGIETDWIGNLQEPSPKR